MNFRGRTGFPLALSKSGESKVMQGKGALCAVEDREDVLLARALIGINASIMMRTA